MQFLKNMLTLNPKDYGSADIPIGIILLGFAVGMILATVISQMVNAVVYRMIKALTRHKCTDEASAKTLKSLGLSGDRWVQHFIKNENPILRRYLRTVKNAVPPTAAPKNADAIESIDAATAEAPNATAAPEGLHASEEAKYYLAPENSDRAKELLQRGEGSVLQTLGLCGLLLALYLGLAALATWLLPLLF